MTIKEWAKDFKSYVNWLDMHRDDYNGIMEYIDDAIDLLKEQESEKVLNAKDRNIINETHGKTGFCPRCHQLVVWGVNRRYCGFCGKGLIWDE